MLDVTPLHSRMTIREHIDDILACWRREILRRAEAGEEGEFIVALSLRGDLVPEEDLHYWSPTERVVARAVKALAEIASYW